MSPRLLFCLPVAAVLVSAARAEPSVDFNRDIRPILSANCFACHGPDEESREADLRLDTAEGARANLGGYRAVVPGEPEESELVYRIETDDAVDVMPPSDSSHELTAEEKDLLRRWVASGAEYALHWSFAPPEKAPPPAVEDESWPRHALDRFVLARLEEKGLEPAREAGNHRWLRRVSLDITGLPPTPEEADAFAADREPGAHARAVDRLLDAPAYGEHWARMWLDLARYADTKGYEKDRPREIWRYRDWVIDALNRDLPYDRFTVEQLAGDLLPDPTTGQLIATAFHRNTMTNDEGGTDDEEFRVAAVKDRVDTTMQVWMGLTMGCAKCHSHKFDPITMEDYYSFYAFFNQSRDADRPSDSPLLASPTEEQKRAIAERKETVQSLRADLEKRPEGFDAAWQEWRRRFREEPAWRALDLASFHSDESVTLSQRSDGTLVAGGERPEKDTWRATFDLAEGEALTALRLDVLPRSTLDAGWPDGNAALREFTAEVVGPDGQVRREVKLANARADFSQKRWEVAKAIDGDPTRGWALAPKHRERHAAVFDFAEPLEAKAGERLRLTLEQRHGNGLLLARFRVSASTHETRWLSPSPDVEAGLRETFARKVFPATRKVHDRLEKAKAALAAAREAVPETPVMRELPADERRETHVHRRGNFLDPGETVEPSVPEVFGPWPEDAPRNRLGVARWLMQPENPLTARVMVNRVWARLFGTGIVETEEDFGAQGLPPSHPGLLDWLAVDFRENGWSLKRLVRTIVLSSTYRQAVVMEDEKLAADPNNRLLGRGPRFRLPAETIRDQALAASGLLTEKVGGPSVMPPQPDGVWKSTYSALTWEDATGPDRFRRAVYTYWKRTSPYPAMMAFDAGSREVCQVRRVRTNTPLQALVTLNDPAFVEAAGALSRRMAKAGPNPEARVERGFRLVAIRPPEPPEVDRLVSLHASMKSHYADAPGAGRRLLASAGLEKGDPALVAVANVLLNLDEVVMK